MTMPDEEAEGFVSTVEKPSKPSKQRAATKSARKKKISNTGGGDDCLDGDCLDGDGTDGDGAEADGAETEVWPVRGDSPGGLIPPVQQQPMSDSLVLPACPVLGATAATTPRRTTPKPVARRGSWVFGGTPLEILWRPKYMMDGNGSEVAMLHIDQFSECNDSQIS